MEETKRETPIQLNAGEVVTQIFGMVQLNRYNVLTLALTRIGRLHDQLKNEESKKNYFRRLILRCILRMFPLISLWK